MAAAATSPRDRSHGLAEEIAKLLPTGFDAEFASFATGESVKLSMYVPADLTERAEEIADEHGFVVGCTYAVDATEAFYTFDHDPAE